MSSMRLYLFSRTLYRRGFRVLPRVVQKINRIINSLDIRYTADIDPSVTLLHNGLGCVIHERAVIGSGTTICQNVTIGGNGKRGDSFDLVIGKNVFIGAGACILSGKGRMYIGDNAVIGANAVVLSSVPQNCTAVGIPARIIYHNASTTDPKEKVTEFDKR